jgi:glucosamine--fructose-6-phosphate aminotransferase (isomerizing)
MALHDKGIDAQALIASEFENFATFPKGTLVIAASQSGETMDTIEALKYAKSHGALIASIVNVPHSTIERLSELSLRTMAGQEIAVASTKAYTNQVLTLLALATGNSDIIDGFREKIGMVLALEPSIKRIAETLDGKHDIYVLGRRFGYPVAREIALKIKEISYAHAEGMMGGELKHGTIALIEAGTPVIGLVYGDNPKMLSSMQEVKARGAHNIVIGTEPCADVIISADDEIEFGLLAAIAGQLLAYHLARRRGRPIDRPRNLAKSVTVG